MSDADGRAWIAEVSYPGKTPFLFGTVFAPREATAYEVERLVTARLLDHVPDGFAVRRLEPGQLVFLGETAERRVVSGGRR